MYLSNFVLIFNKKRAEIFLNKYLSLKIQEVIRIAGNLNQITIETSAAGWGMDIKLSEKVKKAGGLHVIIPMPMTKQRALEQATGPLLDEYGKRILDKNGNFVYSRELIYSVSGKFDVQGNPVTEVVVQDHSYGHIYSNGIGNQSAHYNVRPYNNTKTGRIRGLRDHYYFDYRNEK